MGHFVGGDQRPVVGDTYGKLPFLAGRRQQVDSDLLVGILSGAFLYSINTGGGVVKTVDITFSVMAEKMCDNINIIKPRILGKGIENIYVSYDHELSEITDRFEINSGMIDIRFSNSTLVHIDVFDEIGDDDTNNLQVTVIKFY